MARKKVLIITHTNDNISVDKVTEFINKSGGEAIRFNVDRYPLDYRLSSIYNDNQWQVLLENDHESHNLHDIEACW